MGMNHMYSTHRSDSFAVLHHLGEVVRVVVYLLADSLVLVEKSLRVRQAAGDVLACHVGLGLGQPRLEVVQVAQEPVQVSGLLQLRVSLLQL